MYTQFQRFTATILLFSILLQSCGNPNWKLSVEEVPKLSAKTSQPPELEQHELALAQDQSVYASCCSAFSEELTGNRSAQHVSASPAEVSHEVSSKRLSTPLPIPVRSTVVSVVPQCTSASKPTRAPRPLLPTNAAAKKSVPAVLEKTSVASHAGHSHEPTQAAFTAARIHPTTCSLQPTQANHTVQHPPSSSMTVVASGITTEITYTIAQGHQVHFQEIAGAWWAQVQDVWGRRQVLPIICAPDRTPEQAIQELISKTSSQHKYWLHVLETDQPPWAPRVVYVGALGVRGGGNVVKGLSLGGNVAEKLSGERNVVKGYGRVLWGWVSCPVTAVTYTLKDEIPPLPCRVTTLPKYDEDDLHDSEVDNSCKAAGEWVTFHQDGGYWYAQTSRGKIPVKAKRSASLSLEDLVSSRFSIRKFRIKSPDGYAQYTFCNYDNYDGLGYELELITSSEQVQTNQQDRRRQRREQKKQEEERRNQEEALRREAARRVREEAQKQQELEQKKEADRKALLKTVEERRNQEEALRREAARRVREEAQRQQELEQKKEADREALLKTVSEAVSANFYTSLDQADSLSATHAAQRHSMVRSLARELTQSQSGDLEHEVLKGGYLSDDELDYDLTDNTGSGLDFGPTDDQFPIVRPREAIGAEKNTEEMPSSFEALAERLLHKQERAKTLDPQERELQRVFYSLYQEAVSCFTAWKDISSENYLDPAIQAHLQDLHERLLALPDALSAWEQSLQNWGKSLADWANSLHQPADSSWGVDFDLEDYQDMLGHYQRAEVNLKHTQSQYQALLQEVGILVHGPHYYNALTTPQLQQQAMSFAKTLLQVAGRAAVANEDTLQRAEAASRIAQTRKEKAQDQLATIDKKLVRQTVVVMAHILDHKPLLDYLAGKGCKYINEKDDQGKTALQHAIIRHHPEVVQWLLDHGADQEIKDGDGLTPLHWASQEGHTPSVALLLAAKADTAAKDKNAYTPLHFAAEKGHTATVELLLNAENIDIEARDEEGLTPLHQSVMNGHAAVAKLLLAHNADITAKDQWGYTPLHRAVLQGHESAVALLLDNAADIESQDADRGTPLHLAVQQNHVNIVKLLLVRGADRKAKNSDGFTPLHHAVLLGYTDTLKVLLCPIPNITNQDIDRFTLLHLAAQQGHKAIIELLLTKGAAINAKDADGFTPLHCAARQGYTDAVSLLLARGAAIEAKDAAGCTPLHCAAEQDHSVISELLLIRGADLKAKNTCGQTPETVAKSKGHQLEDPSRKALCEKVKTMAHTLHCGPLMFYLAGKGHHYINEKDSQGKTAFWHAIDLNEPAIVQWLLDHGADQEIKDGFAPLHFAAQEGHTAIVALLLDRGAAIEAKNEAEFTPLHFAAQEGHTGTVELLLARGAAMAAKNSDGRTPLDIAAAAGHETVATLLRADQAPTSQVGRHQVEEVTPGNVNVVNNEVPQTLQVSVQPANTSLSVSSASSQQRRKDSSALAQETAALDAALAVYKAAGETAKAAAQTLEEAQVATVQAKNQSQASLLHLKTSQQRVTQLTSVLPSTRGVACYLQDTVKEAQDYLQSLAESDETTSAMLQQRGNALLTALYAHRQQEQQHYRYAEQLSLCDDTLSEHAQAQLLGEVLPQGQYHIDTLNALIDRLVEQGHMVTGPDLIAPPNAVVSAAVVHEMGSLSLRIAQLGASLPQELQASFQATIVPLLLEKLLPAPPAIQEKVFHYFQQQGGLYPKVLREYPAQAWVFMSLFHDLAQGTSLSDASHTRFHTLAEKLQAQYLTDVLEPILGALKDKKTTHALSLDKLCDVMDMLPEDGTHAQALLQLPGSQWCAALKTTWLSLRTQTWCPHLNADQRQRLIQELAHLDWSLQVTQTLLDQLSPEYSPEELSRLLAFTAQHPIDEAQLLEILVSSAVPQDNVIAHWHHQLACSLLKDRLLQLLPQAIQASTYALIAKLWAHTPTYQAINTFLEQLFLKQIQEKGLTLDPEHLRFVLSMMNDYHLDEATYSVLLQQLVGLPSHQWSQHFHTKILQHCFGEEVHERTTAEIIEYMAIHSPEVAYVQDRAKLAQAHQNILAAYKGRSTTFSAAHPIAHWDAATITKWAKKVKDYANNPGQGTLPTQAELIAVVKRAVELHHGYSPRSTQLLSLLVLLNPTPGQGRLVQINTGEGKSLIVAMFTAIQALLNNKSDIVTTSTELSIPEVEKQRPFFEMLGLSVSENSKRGTQGNDKKKQQAYQQDNVYGTAGDFQGDILRGEFFGKELRMQRPFDCVVVDEVDNMLFDSRSHSIRLSSTMPATNHLSLLLAAVWQRVKHESSHFFTDQGQVYYIKEDFHKDQSGHITILSGEERDPQECMCLFEGDVEDFIKEETQQCISSLLRTLNADEQAAYAESQKLEREISLLRIEMVNTSNVDSYKTKVDKLAQLEKDYEALPWNADKRKYPPIVAVPVHLKGLAIQQVPRWIQSAINAALVYKKGHHYNVHGGKIVPVDYNNTGVWQHNMVWSNGLAQFLQIKEGLKVLPENIPTNFISTVGFFQRYASQLYGLTGTLGNEVTQEFFKKVYHTDLVIVPPYKQHLIVGNEDSSYACKELTPQFVADKDINKWYEAIAASALQHAQQQRAVLIICKYIRQVHTLETRLQERYAKDKIFTYTGSARFEKDKVYPGEIIIATNIAGRGTDLTPSEVVEHYGGLHVCITFLPESYRIELQNAGRTARQGRKGTTQLILHQPEATSIVALRQQRDEQEAKALQQAIDEVGRMTFKDKLFQDFCQLENKLIPTLYGFVRLRHSNLLERVWEIYAKEALTPEVLQDFYEKHVGSLVQAEIDTIPSNQWDNLSHEEKQAQKENILQNICTACPFEEFQKEYSLKKRRAALQELQTELGEHALPPDVVTAFQEGRKYVPKNGTLAVKNNWGPYERRAVEERFGLWFHAHMPQGKEPINFETTRAAFESFLEEIEKDAKANNLIHNAFFYVQRGNYLLQSSDSYAAIAAYDKAIALDPDFSLHARHNKAMALLTPKKNKDAQKQAEEELQEAKLLIGKYKDWLFAFQTLIGHVQSPKPHTAQHLQHHLDILFQQENHIDAAIGVIKSAREEGHHVEITKKTEVDALFDQDATQEHREQALAESRENGLPFFFTIEEKKPKPWLSICSVALIGLVQIAAAILVTIGTAGTMTGILLSQGIADLCTAISSAISGEFSWKEWGISKAISIGISIISMGISEGWGQVKEGARVLKEGFTKGIKEVAKWTTKTNEALIGNIKDVALKIGKNVGQECVAMLLQQGLQEIAGEALEDKITQEVSQKIMQSMLKSTLIQKAMAHDLARGNNYWAQIFIKEGLEMLSEKDSAWYTMLKGIVKGTALQQLTQHIQKLQKEGSSKASILTHLASVGLPVLSGFLTDIHGFTDTFLEDFHKRLKQKYEQELANIKTDTQQEVDIVEAEVEVEAVDNFDQEFMYVMDAQERLDNDELQLHDRYNGQEFSTQAKVMHQQVANDPAVSQEDRARTVGKVLTNSVTAQLLRKVDQHLMNPLTSRTAGTLIDYVTSDITKHVREEQERAVEVHRAHREANELANALEENGPTAEKVDVSELKKQQEADKDREGNVTDLSTRSQILKKTFKLFDEKGRLIYSIGTAYESDDNPAIKLRWVPHPNATEATNTHGHWQHPDGDAVVKSSGPRNCLDDAIVAQLSEADKGRFNLHTGKDLRERGVVYRAEYPEHAQQSDTQYQTLLYSDPDALLRGGGIFADAAIGLQGIETWLNAHPDLISLVQNTGSVVGGALWLKNLTPMGLVSGLVTNYGYNQVLKLMDGNIEVAKQHLTTYFLEHDQEITAEQASYLANLSMQALQTGGQILTHQVAAKKFATVRGAAKKSDPAQGTAKKSDSAQGAAKKSDPVRVTAKKSDPAQGAAKKSDPVKKESNLRPAKNAYELAKAGKLQGETYKNYLHRPEGALKKSISSLQRRIEEHSDKIADPQNYDSAWHTYPKDRQRRVLRRWKGEIKTFTEQKDIFEGILKNRD